MEGIHPSRIALLNGTAPVVPTIESSSFMVPPTVAATNNAAATFTLIQDPGYDVAPSLEFAQNKAIETLQEIATGVLKMMRPLAITRPDNNNNNNNANANSDNNSINNMISIVNTNPGSLTSELPFSTKLDIHDNRNRYHVTKKTCQDQISADTGAVIVTRGRYYPDRMLATERDPPLYLHIAAGSKESLDKAVAMIEGILNRAPTQPAQASTPDNRDDNNNRNSSNNNNNSNQHNNNNSSNNNNHGNNNPNYTRFPVEKVFVNIETDRLFQIRGKLLGPSGSHVKYIQQQTGAKVQLRGIGSDFREISTGTESNEPLHIFIQHQSAVAVAMAKTLAEELIAAVKADFASGGNTNSGGNSNYSGNSNNYGSGTYGGSGNYNNSSNTSATNYNYGGYNQQHQGGYNQGYQQQQGYQGYNNQGYQGQSNTTATTTANTTQQQAAAGNYYDYYYSAEQQEHQQQPASSYYGQQQQQVDPLDPSSISSSTTATGGAYSRVAPPAFLNHSTPKY